MTNDNKIPNSKNYLSILIAFLDILLLSLVIYVPKIINHSSLPFNTYYAIFFLVWLFISVISGKYQFKHEGIINELLAICINAIIVWGLLGLYVISLEKFNKDYKMLYQQILIVLCCELLFRILYAIFNRKKYKKTRISFLSFIGLKEKKWSLMLLDLISVFSAFMITVWVKPATIRIYIPNYYQFLIGLLIWEFIINIITQKHSLKDKNRYRDYIIPILRSNAFTFIILAIFIYIFKLFNLSRLIVFGTVALSTLFELVLVSYISLHSKIRRNIDQSEKIFGVTPLDVKKIREDDYAYANFEDLENTENSIQDFFIDQLNHCCPEIVELIKNNINLKGVEQEKAFLLDTQTIFNVSNIKDNYLKLFINRHKINDFNKINDYFSTLNRKMQLGGYIIGCGETIDDIYKKYHKKYTKPIADIMYYFHFIFKRVLPKLPITQEINYIITNGQNRTMSKTEILGRIVYSGFKIIDTIEINGLTYFIAVKVNVPYDDRNPSYGPFISLKRIGKNGNIIKIYKFRTMHPYSEYIQDYIYESNNLAKGGKLNNDFRITGWGKILRKLWIDELPQIVNFIRGDIKLVGVRALSPHYFNLYPQEFQQYRIQFKPGLLPPFYVDLPETMDEIVASEKKYLDVYSKYKFLIDVKYAAIIMFNIIFRGKRSS